MVEMLVKTLKITASILVDLNEVSIVCCVKCRTSDVYNQSTESDQKAIFFKIFPE